MKNRTLSALLFAACCLLLTLPTYAQPRWVKISRFEVDGKEVHKRFRPLLYVDGKLIEPVRVRNSFVVPPEVEGHEYIDVRFVSEKHNLLFPAVHVSKFESEWVVGVDHKPFEKENIASEQPDPRAKKLVDIYYLSFISNKGLDTRMVIKVYK
jgi:hypothetical protein